MTDREEYTEIIHARIYDSLNIGEENAIHAADLARKFDISTRQLREEVERERAEGALICSSGKGYFRAKNREEIKATYEVLRKRAINTLATIKPFSDFLKRGDPYNEQFTLDDYMDMST